MAEPLRHRQTKEAETDMFSLPPPRHISTLPVAEMTAARRGGRFLGNTRRRGGRGRTVDRRHASLASAIGASPAAAVARVGGS
jgi:hypothetical protein